MTASLLQTPAPRNAESARPKIRGRLLLLVNDASFFLSHRLPLALAARAAGMDVHVATPADDASPKIIAEGFSFHPVAMSRSGVSPVGEVRAFVAIVKLLRTLKPDILHTVTIKPVLYGGLAARLVRQPAIVSAISGMGSVFTERNSLVWGLRKVVTWAYARALRHRNAKVIFQNPEDLEGFCAARIVKKNQAVLIRGSGVDLDRFKSTPLPPDVPIVMFAGRMLWAKGVGEFVRAAERLTADGIRARFVLVGEPDRANPWCVPIEKLKAWDSAGVAEWWGQRQDMPQVIAQAYVFCLPSYREGLPKALLEAAACGRPLVVTDISGCREVVRPGQNGILVPVRNHDALANAIRTLLEDRARAAAMGRRSREIAEAEFGIETVVDQTLNLYKEIA